MADTTDPPLDCHPLATIRAARGWSATDLLAHIADVARAEFNVRLGRGDRAKVYRWEHRGIAPELLVQRCIARLLAISDDSVYSQPWPRWLPAYSGLDVPVTWSAPEAIRSLAATSHDASDDLRGFAGLRGGELARVAEQWSLAPPSGHTALVRGAPLVTDIVAWRLDRQARLLRLLVGQLPARSLLDGATAQLRAIAGLLTGGSYTTTSAHRVFLVAADLAQLAGWAAFDAGCHFAAQRCYLAGLRAAHAAGEATLGGYLLICMAYQAIHLGDPAAAVRLAAAACAGDGSTAAQSILRGHQMLIYGAARGPSADVEADFAPTSAPIPRHQFSDPAWLLWFDGQPPTPFSARRYRIDDNAGTISAAALRLKALPSARIYSSPPPTRQQLLHRLARHSVTHGPISPEVTRALCQAA